MKFTLAQTGDWHIGAGRSSTSWGPEVSNERSRAMIRCVYKRAIKAGADALLICGDVFDHKLVLEPERELLAEELARAKLPTYILAGNHDTLDESNTSLDWLRPLAPKLNTNLVVTSARESIELQLKGDLWLTLAPAFLSETTRRVLKHVSSLDPKRAWVFAGHGPVDGSVIRAGKALETQLSLRKAAQAEHVLYWAYGDIHKAQRLPTLPKSAIGYYAGSPIQLNFGEDAGRGIRMVEFEHSGGAWCVASTRRVQIDDHQSIRPLLTVKSAAEADQAGNALIRLAKGVTLNAETQQQVIRQVVDKQYDEISTERLSKAVPFDARAEAPEQVFAGLWRGLRAQLPAGSDEALRKNAKSTLRSAVSYGLSQFRSRA